ncbi:hypothetical protein ATANTOWER_030822 [Ataeniobius toweri]|uniref:Uncharacterized protein n=1 Tax=Ataeniobius toweri TaxID=208326 RepID=A0ABU7B9J5_9TELE|nr:hypothetical protein [Ataeniobius toweri]
MKGLTEKLRYPILTFCGNTVSSKSIKIDRLPTLKIRVQQEQQRREHPAKKRVTSGCPAGGEKKRSEPNSNEENGALQRHRPDLCSHGLGSGFGFWCIFD